MIPVDEPLMAICSPWVKLLHQLPQLPPEDSTAATAATPLAATQNWLEEWWD
jgi:hypothetical protein